MTRHHLRRPRLHRPSGRRLGAVLTGLGVLTAVAILIVPVKAAFADDPLLRYSRFTAAETGATAIKCGAPLTNLIRRSDGLSFYRVARDDACREAASRRAATAVAGGGVVALLGLLAVTAAAGKART